MCKIQRIGRRGHERLPRVDDAMRHVTRGDMLGRGVDVRALVVEKGVGAERAQYFALVEAAEEKNLVDTDVPCAQRPDDPLVGWRAACGDERRRNRARIIGKIRLDQMETGEEFLEGATGKRTQRGVRLTSRERGEPFFLIYALGFVGKEH